MFGSLGSFFGGIGNFVKDISPLLGLAGGIYGVTQQNSMQKKQIQAQKDLQREQYDNALAAYNAQAAAAGSGSGGGGGMNRAAALANERARLKALKKAIAYQKKMGVKARKELEPWAATGKALLPQVAQTYGNSLSGMNALMSYLQQPEQMKQLGGESAPIKISMDQMYRGSK